MTVDVADQAIAELLQRASRGDEDAALLRSFQHDGKLGAGGMGAVFRVRNIATGELRAVKLILPLLAANPHALQLFAREIGNMQALEHHNVVRSFGAGASGDTVFIVMEYCDGGSVDALIQRAGGRVPLQQAADTTIQLLDALEYLHSADVPDVQLQDGRRTAHGLVHRDIKPQNVFLTGPTERLVAKLGDYGLSKAFEFAGKSGVTLPKAYGGTLSFMPRTQLGNYRDAKPEVDVWAAAATMYAMLTGSSPRDFTGSAGDPAIMRPVDIVERTRPIPIRERVSSIPASVAGLLDRALDDEGDLLFQQAVDFRSELRRAVVE